jgi:hypothetical protein
MDVDMPTALELIRKNPSLYLGNVAPSPFLQATRLAENALIAGALRVELRRLDARWMAVSAESDWITPSAQKARKGLFLREVFTGLMPQ